jgi:hypothetical protein
MFKNVSTLFCLLFAGFTLSAQPAPRQDIILPKVFFTGEYESIYENLVLECGDHLLSVCDGSMEDAYSLWIEMLAEMEEYADAVEFDIKGVKIWMTAYWNTDGSIKHIVYYPKPSSKNMDFDKLSEFLNDFSKTYILPKKNENCFSHNGIAAFPTFARFPRPE